MGVLREAVLLAWESVRAVLVLALPRVGAVAALLAIGLLLGRFFQSFTRRVLASVGFDDVLERAGLGGLFPEGGGPRPGEIAGRAVSWLVFLVFLLSAGAMLGMGGMNALALGMASFIPNLIIALVILAVGLVMSGVAWRSALLAAHRARLPSPRLIGAGVRVLCLLLTAAMALEQISVARTVVVAAFAITFGAVMTALSIAFGIGGANLATRILDRELRATTETKPTTTDARSHL